MSEAVNRDQANAQALERLVSADPVLVDVQPAGKVVPGMTPRTILASGPPMAWDEFIGGQLRAVIGGALYEGLARDEDEADAALRDGSILLGACHEHGCVGSVAGIYTASMPVFVVENALGGNRGYCNFFEGPSRMRLNYGVYNEEVRQGLRLLEEVIAPTVGAAVRHRGGIPLRPFIRRALHMGDEMHSRNTAATLLFSRELFDAFLDISGSLSTQIRRTLEFLTQSDYFFLRLSMAASKVAVDAAHGVEGSSIVTAMTMGCRGFALRVSGLPGSWFRGPHAVVEARLFEGFTQDDIEWMGGESQITETAGLGGFAQAAAFGLQAYQGGTADEMVRMNRAMYEITVGEHPEFKIPYFGFRGTPVGIDIFRVLETGISPVIDAGLAGKDGGQIGAGTLRAPLECFRAAADAYARTYVDGMSAESERTGIAASGGD